MDEGRETITESVGGTSKKKKRSSPLLLVDYRGRCDSRFHFEKVGVVDASLPEAVIDAVIQKGIK
jgi:hypothetical protein